MLEELSKVLSNGLARVGAGGEDRDNVVDIIIDIELSKVLEEDCVGHVEEAAEGGAPGLELLDLDDVLAGHSLVRDGHEDLVEVHNGVSPGGRCDR